MRLSEVKGERVFDVIADCIEPIANIAADPEASRMFKREKLPEGRGVNEFLLERARQSVPPLLKNHKSDVITILSTIAGETYEEYASSLTLGSLINDVLQLLTDEAFTELFISSPRQTGSDISGSASENTGGQNQ